MSKHQIGNILFGIFTLGYGFGFFFWNWPISIYFIILLIYVFIIVYGSFQIKANYHLKAISAVKTQQKVVAITFDDGPTKFTEKILKHFENQPHKATFFCVGEKIKQHPEIFKKIIKQNHQVGNHTFSHSTKMGFKSKAEILTEIQKTDEVIQQFTSQKNELFRPPFGVTNPNIRKALQQTQHRMIGWKIRSFDTRLKDENKILKRICQQITPGSIILLHDTSEKTEKVVKKLLDFLNEKSYRSMTIEELLKLEK